MNNVTFYFLNSNKEPLSLKFKNQILNKNKFYNQPSLTKTEGIFKVRDLFKFNLNADEKSINILENNIKESLLYHENFLSLNLPQKIEVEIVRSKKTEQLEHNLRRNSKFKTIQEFFLSKEKVEKKNRQDKVSGESVQKYVLIENTPRLRLAIDFAKEFDYTNPPNIFDRFLTELRKTIPISVINQNIEQTNKIITELMVLHESAHIILDEKINKTYFKAAYELKNAEYSSTSIKQFVRLVHEGFADGIATYLGNVHYSNNNIIQHYRNARDLTKHKTESKNILNIYETVTVIDRVNNAGQLNHSNLVNYVFDISVNNALKELEKKLNSSEIFKNNLLKDLTYLESKGCFQFVEDKDIVNSLKNNLFEQLNNPLHIKQILLNEEKNETKKQVFKNMDSILTEFRANDYTNEKKLKR